MRITDKRTALLAARQQAFKRQWAAEDALATATGLAYHQAAALVSRTYGQIQHIDSLLERVETGETKCPECIDGIRTHYDPGDRDCGMPASYYREECGACHGMDLDGEIAHLAAEVTEPDWADLEVA